MGRSTQVAELLETLAGDDPEVVRRALDEFSAKDQAAALASREAGNGGSQTLFASTHLTSAQLLDLHNTAIQLADAPGEGRAISIFAMTTFYEEGNTPYAEQGYVIAGTPSGITADTEKTYLALLDGLMSNGDYWGVLMQYGAVTWVTTYPNEPLILKNNGLPIIDGDGTLTVGVYYVIFDGESYE